jgi:hypothetical protein
MSRILEYVISGPAYLRLGAEQCNDPETLQMILDMINHTVHNKNNHQFSLLYNGFTEKNFGQKLQKFRPAIKNIHADSGGLQIITRGLQNTPETRGKVFENQAKFADIGMAFDEIPVKSTSASGTSAKIDTKRRYVDMENFESYARQTGLNVKDQIIKFDSLNSKCRPFVILQGSGADTYAQWAECMLDEIPKELHHRIGGVAMGSAALGMGPLEDVKRAFYVTSVPFERPFHLHVLGVGALKRILPYLLFSQTGLYKDIDISYDSTTHSMSLDNGLFYFSHCKKNGAGDYGGSSVKMGRPYSNIYRTVTEEINNVCGTNYDPVEYHKLMNIAVGEYMAQGGKFIDIMRARLGFILTNVHNFTMDVSELMNSKENFLRFCRDKNCENEYATLFDVKNNDDFIHWEKHVGRFMDSEPVNAVAPSSLEDLFA